MSFKLTVKAILVGLASMLIAVFVLDVAAIAGVGPMVGPGHSDSFLLSCTSSVTLIQSPFGQVSYRAFVDDAAGEDVYFGDSAVTTAIGEPAGAGEKIGGNVRKEYCRVASTSTSIRVRALTAVEQSSVLGQMMLAYHQVMTPEMFANRTEIGE